MARTSHDIARLAAHSVGCTREDRGIKVTAPHVDRPRYRLAVLRVKLLEAGYTVEDRTLYREPSILVLDNRAPPSLA